MQKKEKEKKKNIKKLKKKNSKICFKFIFFREENRIKRVTQYQERRKIFLKTITTTKTDDEDEDLLINYDDEEIESKNIVGIKDSLLKDLYDSSDEDDEELPQKNPFFEEEVPYQTPKV